MPVIFKILHYMWRYTLTVDHIALTATDSNTCNVLLPTTHSVLPWEFHDATMYAILTLKGKLGNTQN